MKKSKYERVSYYDQPSSIEKIDFVKINSTDFDSEEKVSVMPETNTGKECILAIKNLAISFKTSNGMVEAVRGVNFELNKGDTLAIVGESGSGKSVTVRAIMGILSRNGQINSGTVDFAYERDGQKVAVDIMKLSKSQLRKRINGKRIAMIFQDPTTSLNPTMTIGEQVMEGMLYHLHKNRDEAFKKAIELLELVGIRDAGNRMKMYPHQLSGGMCQRVVIAIALSCDPELLICDEPTTALDVTIQFNILELIKRIQRQLNISVIYVTHDLSVVAKVADYVAVMYAGKIVEKGTVEDIFYRPRHPYTWGLLSAIPGLNEHDEKLYAIPGNPANVTNVIVGDAFEPRNIYALNIDKRLEPPMFKISDTHFAATWLLSDKSPEVDLPDELKEKIRRMLEEGRYNRESMVGN